MEIWKQIKEFPNYHASSLGRIRGPLKIRKAHINRCGYLQVHVSEGAKHEAVRTVHSLIAVTFLGPPPRGKKVNHKNGVKKDNRIENLEYLTPKENTQHAAKLFLMPFGERNNKAKLTNEQIAEIRASDEIGRILGVKYGVCQSTISAIKRGKTWPHLIPPSESGGPSVQ